MNTKAQAMGVGLMILTAVGLIVGLVLYSGGIAPNLGTSLNTVDLKNVSYTSAAAANTSINIDGQVVQGDIIVLNASDFDITDVANFTVSNNQVVNGVLTATLETTDDTVASSYEDVEVKLSYTSEPDGYVTSSGSRSIIQLIAIFAIIALIVHALGGTSRVMEMVGK